MHAILKTILLALVCAVAAFGVGFFWSTRLNTIVFWPGDFSFPFAHRAGLIALLFDRNSEGSHHLWVLLFSLLCWWFLLAVLFVVALLAYQARQRFRAA